jgi:opacity protein-like surface antigen
MQFTSDLHSKSPLVICLVVLASLLSMPSPASAEWFADLYAGAAYTPKSDITLVVSLPSGPADHTFHDVKWDTSPTFGGRLGYWFESAPWLGIGLDVFYFNANIPTQTVSTTILGVTAPATLRAIDVSTTVAALDFALRYPLQVDQGFPKGRIQPYVTAGPAVFWTRAKNKENTELTTEAATDSATGYKVGAGLSWLFSQHAAVFAEFRYTHVHTEPVLNSALSSLRVPLQFDLDTQHVVAGVSYRF